MNISEQIFIKKTLEAKLFQELKDKKIHSVKTLENMYPEYVGYLDLDNIYKRIENYQIQNGIR